MAIKMNMMVSSLIILTAIVLVLGIALTTIGKLSNAALSDVAITDETIAVFNNTFTSLANSNVKPSSATFKNASLGTDYSASFFTFNDPDDYEASSVKVSAAGITGGVIDNTSVNISYTFGSSTNEATAISSTVTSLDDFIDWLGVIVIAIVGGIVFFIITKSFQK